MRRSVAAIVLVLLAAACGGSSPKTYDVNRSTASLRQVGWLVSPAPTLPDALGGARQVAYLETTAPDSRRLDLHFFDAPAGATAELDARRRKVPRFAGATIGSVLVVPAGERDDPVPEADLAALRRRLRT